MADIVDPLSRSRLMARIPTRDTRPEMVVRRFLHAAGHRYRLHARDLPGCPDLVFRTRRIAVFVHGCYWHRHQDCHLAYTPKSRVEFWDQKFTQNVRRDERVRAELETLGWKVITVWECQTRRGNLDWILEELARNPEPDAD